FPLYKGGTVVGGVGVIADGIYGLDADISNSDRDVDELIATAATFNFGAPLDRRGDRITVDGKTFRFSDVDFSNLARDPATAPAFATLGAASGALLDVPLFFVAANGIVRGTVFGQPESGVRAEPGLFPGRDAFVLVSNFNANRFPPRGAIGLGGGSLTQTEVTAILDQALGVANQARAQIRRPTDSQARVSVSVVDLNGGVLGVARTRDAPIFGLDVSLQKARTALFFSDPDAAAELTAAPDAVYLNPDGTPGTTRVRFADYVADARGFFGLPNLFSDGIWAFSARSIGNISRPYYPDGVLNTRHGPLSKPFPQWSPFSDGLQLDLVYNKLASILGAYIGFRDGVLSAPAALLRVTGNCTGMSGGKIRNGIQIFPGGMPIYRGDQLVGGVGVSGDGIDQDDMVSFLGLARASALIGGIGHAPPARRADQLVPQGTRLRYVQCPQGPLLNSQQSNVCAGL
ncbi:MAG: heme-binding protein, partial [Lysobacterales bacterium]